MEAVKRRWKFQLTIEMRQWIKQNEDLDREEIKEVSLGIEIERKTQPNRETDEREREMSLKMVQCTHNSDKPIQFSTIWIS